MGEERFVTVLKAKEKEERRKALETFIRDCDAIIAAILAVIGALLRKFRKSYLKLSGLINIKIDDLKRNVK